MGDLTTVSEPKGIVLFAHGSGSGRHSSRNRYVARALNDAALATLLLDLLTESEEQQDAEDAHLRFDIPLLAGRLEAAVVWLRGDVRTSALPLGIFGASTGAAAALIAAARQSGVVEAVVSRGGRPDLASDYLGRVKTPTLLIVGSRDAQVLELNRYAMERLSGPKSLAIVPNATHLFEEEGTLDAVNDLAARWFLAYLGGETEHLSHLQEAGS